MIVLNNRNIVRKTEDLDLLHFLIKNKIKNSPDTFELGVLFGTVIIQVNRLKSMTPSSKSLLSDL